MSVKRRSPAPRQGALPTVRMRSTTRHSEIPQHDYYLTTLLKEIILKRKKNIIKFEIFFKVKIKKLSPHPKRILKAIKPRTRSRVRGRGSSAARGRDTPGD